MDYKEAKKAFLRITPKFKGEDKGYDSLVVALGRAMRDTTKKSEKKKDFIKYYLIYIGEYEDFN